MRNSDGSKAHEWSETAEPIRHLPVWLARFANFVVGWTDDKCTAGCGYPITGRYRVEIEKYGDTSIMMGVCSLKGACEEAVRTDPKNAAGQRYAEWRPELIEDLKSRPVPVPTVLITY